MKIPAKLIGRSTRSSATVLKSLTSRGVLTWHGTSQSDPSQRYSLSQLYGSEPFGATSEYFEVIGTGTPAGNAKEPCRVAEFQQSPTQHTASELFQSKFGVFWSNPAAHRAARPRFSRSVLLVDICRRVRLGKRPVTDW